MKESREELLYRIYIQGSSRRFDVYFTLSRVTGDEETNVYRDDEDDVASREKKGTRERGRFTGKRRRRRRSGVSRIVDISRRD